MPPIFGVLFDGLAYGMLLFLMSVGLSVTLGMMNFVNLAHCSFAMLGGYVAITLMNAFAWPFLATLPVAFIAAAKGMAWDSPRGPMSIDPQTRDVVQTVHISKVEKVGGELRNVEIDKVPNVKDPGHMTQ